MVCNQITGNIIMKWHLKITRVHILYCRNRQCSCTVRSSCVCCKQLTHPVIYCPVDFPLLVSRDWSTAVSGYFVSLPSIQLSAWWWTCDRSCSKQPVQRVMMPTIKGSATRAWEISPWGRGWVVGGDGVLQNTAFFSLPPGCLEGGWCFRCMHTAPRWP